MSPRREPTICSSSRKTLRRDLASRGNKSDFEVAAEILGGGNGRKASGGEIAEALLTGPRKD